jgi:hypothetical protein
VNQRERRCTTIKTPDRLPQFPRSAAASPEWRHHRTMFALKLLPGSITAARSEARLANVFDWAALLAVWWMQGEPRTTP